MRLKVASGVRVSVTEDEGNKLLAFDQNVRAIALEPTEAARIGASLYRSKRMSVFPRLVSLVESGFFKQHRTFTEVRKTVKSLEPNIKSPALTMALRSFCNKGILSRVGRRRNYMYTQE